MRLGLRRAGVLLASAVLLAVTISGCGDDDGKKDAGPGTEAGLDGPAMDMGADAQVDTLPPDTLAPDTMPTGFNMGEGCNLNSECKVDMNKPTCVQVSSSKGIGICSRECIPDDPASPLSNEDNCPSGFVCASFVFTSATFNYCLKKCTPDLSKNTCPASSKQTCHPVSTRYSGELDTAVCWYLACEDDKDCPVFSDVDCVADTECASVGADAFCDDNELRCARPGNCTVSGMCGPHTYGSATGKVGDPCTSDFQCPNNGFCNQETNDAEAIGSIYTNGYCAVMNCSTFFAANMSEFTCPAGSVCHNLYYGGVCFKSCTLDDPSSCRGQAQDKGGDYECYSYATWQAATGVPAATAPVCMTTAFQDCAGWAGSSYDCSVYADTGNPTNMVCRDRFTGIPTTDKYDVTGVCLDDTASGPFQQPPDAGPDVGQPDAGQPDAAAPDAVAPDASQPDTVAPDAGAPDAPMID
jgi:hypothetical protein